MLVCPWQTYHFKCIFPPDDLAPQQPTPDERVFGGPDEGPWVRSGMQILPTKTEVQTLIECSLVLILTKFCRVLLVVSVPPVPEVNCLCFLSFVFHFSGWKFSQNQYDRSFRKSCSPVKRSRLQTSKFSLAKAPLHLRLVYSFGISALV